MDDVGECDNGEAKKRRTFSSCLQRHWMLVAVLLTSVIAALLPDPGVDAYSVLNVPILAALFFFQGLLLDIYMMRESFKRKALPSHIALQAFSLLATPLMYYIIVYRWHWEVSFLGKLIADGAMVALCMPTTTSTSLLFTQIAGGDASFAALHCCAGQLLGILIAPFLASALLESKNSVSPSDLLDHAKTLALRVALPLLCGIGTNMVVAKRCAGGGIPPRIRKIISAVNIFFLIALLWMIFCKAASAAEGTSRLDASTLLILLAWISCIHIIVAATAWFAASPFPPERRVAFAIVGAQKTEAMALAILSLVFSKAQDDLGILSLPIIAYHSIQMIAAALALPKLGSWLGRRTQMRDDDNTRRLLAHPNRC